ncbi:hypothetical protein L861_03825 [Litchfieldella anticariensis FP35 = DSM 16096]|uniref:Uncharacterized protein n=1 Tax=Litchfieldella anticariensis (strain DSM 16096 / CECT 5854 / CIP 108499 / LMG 22089 / FP35) TaxID=1121939 RepID=S2L9F0_LITA3|nr:hypothetical protein [Halomonas anticariensis]EPC04464.1 hypothetical protein L861_03825 [Halomonas anticariensis FP35 = DSM 16096]
MLRNAIEIRKVFGKEGVRYEVYDADTGTSLGVYDTIAGAEEMRQSMKSSQDAEQEEANDPDPTVE